MELFDVELQPVPVVEQLLAHGDQRGAERDLGVLDGVPREERERGEGG